ncbi:MAG: hypothetical protein DMG13_00745 [Acidobacteria bacterium]|nr:MAG: hypothetical protein DMG13_00745 [Acidobacteriota bacterium]
MRKIGFILGILAAVILLTVVAVWLFVDVNQYRGLIQAQLERQLDRKVTLGKIKLGLLPLRLQVDEPVIAEDPSFGRQSPFIRAEKLDVRVSLLSLLVGNIKVHSLELLRPNVELVKNKRGVWNYASLGAGSAGKSPASGESAKSAFALDRVAVRDGQVAVTNLQQRQARAVYDHIDLTLLHYAAGQPFSFDLAVHVGGEGAQELHLKGDAGPVSEDNPARTPFRGTLSVKKAGIDRLQKFLNADILSNATGVLSAESQITNQSGTLHATGSMKLEEARFNGAGIGYPITLDYDIAAKLAEGILVINSATVHLGETPLSVAGSINVNAPANLNVNIKSDDVSIAEIQRLASAFGLALAPGTTIRGHARANVQVRGPATNPALSGTIAGRDLEISGKDIPQRVEVKALDLALSPGEIRSNEFDVISGKTTATGRLAIRQYTSKSPVIDAALRAPAATLPEVQSLAKAYGMTGLDQINGAGTLNLDLRAAGPLHSASTFDVIRALNGDMDLDFNALRIAGFDAGRELATIGGFSAPASGNPNLTDVLRLTGRITVKDGIAQTNNLEAQLLIGKLAAKGTADVATEVLNLKLSVVLSKAFSDKVGGTRVGGYMNTALSNSAGELVIPAMMTGSFKQPKFAPDVQAFVEMQKKKLLPTFDNPAAGVSSMLGAFTGKKDKSQDQPTGQTEQKPAGTIKGILGGLFDRKKPDPPQ